MKSIFSTVSIFLLMALFPSGAHATFPGKSIAHWDLSVSDEQNEPEYQRVRKLMREKSYDKALKVLEGKIASAPKEATPVILKALVLNEMGEYGEALTFLRKGEKMETRHPAIPFAFCQIYRNFGVADLSERACRITVDQHRNTPETHHELAQTLAALGNMVSANKELALAADLDPKNPRYHYERGMNFNYLNRFEEAEKSFLQALAIDETDLGSLYQLAYLYAASKKPDKAKPYIMKALETKKEHPDVHSAKLLLDYIHNDALDKLPLKKVPHEYHVDKSKFLYQSGKPGLALIEIQTAARLKPEDLPINEILIGLSSILMRLDITEKTVNHVLKLENANNTAKAKGYQELGDIQVVRGNLPEARKYYNKALSLGDPNDIAKITLDEFPGKTVTPAPLNTNNLFFDPAEALNRKGEIFAHYKMYERAIALYSVVVRIAPNHLLSQLNSATAYYHRGDHSRAITIM